MVEVLKGHADDLLKIWIHLDGPEVILTLARERDPTVKLPLTSTHSCETCLFLYREPAHRKVVLELVHEKRDDIIRRYTESSR